MGSNDSSITISLIAKDLASGNISKAVAGLDALAKKGGLVGSMAQGLGISFGMMLNPFRLAQQAIGAVTDFLGDAARAAMEDEASQNRLRASLEANVPSWDGTTDAIEKNIEAGQLLGFTDDALRATLTTLVAASHDVDEAQRDMALAMDLARFKGIDLRTASDALIKVHAGQYRALKTLGIQINANATSEEALAAVQKVTAGQAEAYANSTAGAMESTQIAIGEVVEDIGKELLPGIRDAALFVRDDLIPAIGAIAGVWGTATGAAHDFFDAVTLGGLSQQEQITAVLKGIAAIGEEYGSSQTQIRQWQEANLNALKSGEQGAAELLESVRQTAEGIAREWEDDDLRERNQRAMLANMLAVQGAIEDSQPDLMAAMGNVMTGLSDTIRGSKDVVAGAMDDLKWAMLHPLAGLEELARIQGELTGSELAAGLASSNPFVRSQAEQTKQTLIEQWEKIAGIAYDQGFDAQREYARGLAKFRQPHISVRWPTAPGHTSVVVGGSGAQHGGRAWAGEPITVGEFGRAETFIPDSHGYISPRAGGAGGGSFTFNFNYHGLTPPTPAQGQAMAQVFIPELVREMQRQRIL